jgi:hypothetical protein
LATVNWLDFEVSNVDSHELADAQPTAVQGLKHDAVAHAKGVVRGDVSSGQGLSHYRGQGEPPG